jgi:septal ring-binding cell division protein DamX
MAQADDDPVRGKTMRWTFTDGPTAGSTYEHVFGQNGTVKYKLVGGGGAAKPDAKGKAAQKKPAKATKPDKPDSPKYAAMRAANDVYAVSYLSGSGYTLTVVLNHADKTLVGFASNDKQWFPVKGTFETVA